MNLGDVPTSLYKYVRPERVDIVRNRSIRFTQPTATNDLFELKAIFDTLVPADQFEQHMRPSKAMIEKSIRDHYSKLPNQKRKQLPFKNVDELLAMVHSKPQIFEQLFQSLMPQFETFVQGFLPQLRSMMNDTFGRMIGILSLTETATNELMWAHYADDHRGFALTFDAHDNFFNRRRSDKDEFFHLRRVSYFDRTAEGTSLLDLDGDDMFFTKASRWSYEREWRMIAPLGEDIDHAPADNEVVLINFPAAALREIIVGVRTSSDVRNSLSKLLQSDPDLAHVKLRELKLVDACSKLEVK